PCVGREREISVLMGLYDECRTEEVARAVMVTGTAGSGESRLRYEFLRRLKERGDRGEVWLGRGGPMSAGAPLGLRARACRRTAGIYEGEPVGVRRQKLRARLGRAIAEAELPRVAEFLGELIGTPFPDDDSVQLRAARQDPVLMGDQMRRAWEAL